MTVETVTGGVDCLLTVVDNGNGIPPSERTVLEKETEEPLDHGSGLGLWVVAWAVRSLDGEISFDTSSDGTEVRIRLPLSSGPEDDVPS